MIRSKRATTAVVVASASALLLAACGSGSGSNDSPSEGAPSGDVSGSAEVFSWWTSGSESAALDALFAQTTSMYPDLEMVNAAVAGGAGTNAQQVLATRLAGGEVPETWQTHPGGALGDYFNQGVLTDLTDLYAEEGWDKTVPQALIDSMTYDGQIVAALTGVHRGNVFWYNKPLVEGAGLTVPESVNWADFAEIAGQLQSKGITPLCLGDKDIWAAGMVVESTIVGEIGAEGWAGLMDGSKKWSDPEVVTAIGHFNDALAWTNGDHKSQDWSGAVSLLADGSCAFNVMGDWAYGELVTKHEKVDGTDFGYTIVGDADTFVTVGDAFVEGKGSKNPAGAAAFLTAVMSKDGQINFNKLKGSSPVRNDVDVTQLGTYQQGAYETLNSGTLIPSLVHGQALTPAANSQAFADAVTLLEADGDADAFAKSMDAAFANNK
ncbi:ABC transporter substrate-binding protein [Cellulomonas sp.]|uniref:ABC transporter substrate-binding protein n=1 Tax=Cellulomonas sp. TaxID=40001 RepID=UPI003BAC75B2